jgi:hypothetical protein
MSVLADIKTLLTAINSNVYLRDMPDTPDNCLVVYHAGGRLSEHSFDQVTTERPTIQVRIRNTSFATAETQAEAVKDALNGKTDTTINSNVYLSIMQRSDILSLGRDDRNRINLVVNFDVTVKRS